MIFKNQYNIGYIYTIIKLRLSLNVCVIKGGDRNPSTGYMDSESHTTPDIWSDFDTPPYWQLWGQWREETISEGPVWHPERVQATESLQRGHLGYWGLWHPRGNAGKVCLHWW